MSQLSSRIARALAISLTVVAVVAACGSEGGSTFDPNSDGGGTSNGSAGTSGGTSGIGGTSGSSGGDGDGGTTSGTSGNIDPSCKPLTCAEQGLECGLAGDGCGRQIDCNKTVAQGGCSDDPTKRCGADGAPSKCVAIVNIPNTCTPKSCNDLGVTCGQAGDGCGGLLTCGTCAADEQCGAPGRPSQCVKITATSADGGACVPKTAADFPVDDPLFPMCGDQSDGCGGVVTFSATCPDPTHFCGGRGPSRCGPPGGGTCTKRTCAFYPATACGMQSDGCGGVIGPCGSPCVAPEVCGGGGVPSQCGGGVLTDDAGNSCTPKSTCGPLECGQVADGCGGVFDCGLSRCVGDQICGGGGTPNICGAPACTRLSRAQACLNKNCGPVSDGCGGTYNCNTNDAATACTAPQICGGGGVPNVCGGGAPTADGGPGGGTCVPKTAADCVTTAGNRDCGPLPDGCGGTYTCGTAPTFCGAGESCGAITPSKCGTPQCTPQTQAAACAGKTCGFVPDGCGGSHQCGVGSGTCPYAGRIGDSCGGGGTANVCGGGVPCTGTYCGTQPTNCSGANTPNTTRILGRVYAPNGTLPIHDALIYVPNGTLAAVQTGINSCDTCAPPSGSPFVQTNTNTSGNFTLTNVPVPVNGSGVAQPITLVIQKGRWRKVQTVTPNRCGDLTLTTAQGSFGSTQSGSAASNWVPSNNIPRFAVTTGGADAMQCLFRRIGIDDTEFTLQNGAGRVHLFAGANGGTSRFRNNFVNKDGTADTNGERNFTAETALYGNNSTTVANTAELVKYDGVVLTCTGENDSTSRYPGYYDDMKAYADAGGKIFASHWHHGWVELGPSPWGGRNTPPTPPLVPIADIAHNGNPASPITATINTGIPFGADLSAWLQSARGGGTAGQLSITESRNTINSVDTTRARSIITLPNGGVQYSDFLTPLETAATTKCGRFVLSDLHVTGGSGDSVGNGSGGGDSGFPNNCSTSALTDQQRVLAYMLFDLTTCINNTPPPSTCTPRTCASYPQNGGPNNGAICGQYSDGCSDIIKNAGGQPQSCGTCPSGQSCVNGYCQIINCTPRTCQAGECGSLPDGCGGTLNCTCPPGGGTCGGGGQANRCGTPSCTPLTCTAGFCGSTGNGCGGTLDCTCPPGQLCGGAGQPNQCGVCTPIPQATACAGKNCGDVPNGCSGFWHCGDCASGQNCGGSGQANVCGSGSCVARSCAEMGAQCGRVGDGCGGFTDCPNCTGTDFCNGDNLCIGTTCTPKTCQQQGIECGPASNTCGGLIANCGDCPPGTACGAGGQPGKCGTIPCTPSTCTSLGAVCGQVANGCGGLTQSCGSCPGTNSCVNGACVQTCTPRTCTEAAAQCGFVGDGCGGALDCGQCQPGQTCGAGNRCIDDGPK